MDRRIFHLCSAAAAEALDRGEALRPESLAREGFVHLSTEAQLQGTLDLHFAADRFPHAQVLLLELRNEAISEQLVFEPSRGGALFPHLYRALLPTDVRARHVLQRGPDGSFPGSRLFGP